MNLFNARLLRSFAIGFALGAVGVVAVANSSHSGGNQVVPAAIAAPAH